jgi:hypothetical protein
MQFVAVLIASFRCSAAFAGSLIASLAESVALSMQLERESPLQSAKAELEPKIATANIAAEEARPDRMFALPDRCTRCQWHFRPTPLHVMTHLGHERIKSKVILVASATSITPRGLRERNESNRWHFSVLSVDYFFANSERS